MNDLPRHLSTLITQGISVNSSYSSNIKETDGGLPEQIGNKTECALLGFVNDLGSNYRKLREEMPDSRLTKVYTFNSERKSMSTIVPLDSGGYRVYTKGASEIVLKKCSFIVGEGGTIDEFNTPLILLL